MMMKPTLIARVRDVRVWIWPLALATAWFATKGWIPADVLWQERAGAPASVIAVRSAAALILPSAGLLAALVGLTRAWSGRSLVNGAYLIGCSLVALISGYLSWTTATYRLAASEQRVIVQQHGFYFRTFERGEIARITEHQTSRRGVVRGRPQLELVDGSRVVISGALAWAWADEVSTLWGLPKGGVR